MRKSVCLPQDCVPTQGGDDARTALNAIGRAAAAHKLYVVANLKELAGAELLFDLVLGRPGRPSCGEISEVPSATG